MDDKQRIENIFNRIGNMVLADAIDNADWALFRSLGFNDEQIAIMDVDDYLRKRYSEVIRNSDQYYINIDIDINNMPDILKSVFNVGNNPSSQTLE